MTSLFLWSLGVLAWPSHAAVTVNELFSDGLILQTNKQFGARSFVYGTAAPNESISITGTIQGAPYSSAADGNGDWKIEINPSTNLVQNYTLSIIGSESNDAHTINDIRMGDVFLCIGADDMQRPMSAIDDALLYIADSVKYPKIYTATIPTRNADTPQNTFNSQSVKWTQANPSTVGSFSALCYLSAQRLLDLYNDSRPMGLIQATVSQSTLDCWMSSEALQTANEICANSTTEPRKSKSSSKSVCSASSLFNGMLAPLTQQTFRAGIWDQWEPTSDVDVDAYGCKWQVMVNDLRDKFGSGDYAFAYVQRGTAAMRAQQDNNQPSMGGRIDTTAMAVAYDLSDTEQALLAARVGVKLARVAPAIIYDHNRTLYDGPVIGSALRSGSQSGADAIVMKFDNLDNRTLLLLGTAGCSECCAANDIVQVSVDGATWTNTSTYVVNNSLVSEYKQIVPQSVQWVRYAATDVVQCALYREGLDIPAAPFVIAVNASSSLPKKNTWTRGTGERAAQTPPMGFNHWNFAHCNIDERLALKVANFMVSSGLRDAGYHYFNLDDCWQTDREYTSGRIIPDSVRFPSGMASLSAKLHALGLSFGVYTSRSQFTCQGRDGSYSYEYIDGDSYCEWGVDFLKVDACGGERYSQTNESWIKFREAMDACYLATGRDMVLSVESCGSVSGCGEWIAETANMWRTGGDIQDNWKSVMANADHTQAMWSIAGPGHWNDADMLEIGNPGLSLSEQRVQLSLWAIMAAPMLIGTNLLQIGSESLAVLMNTEVIAVNQDVLGVAGHKLYANESGTEVWFRPLSGGEVAVCLLNRMSAGSAEVTVRFADVGLETLGEVVQVRDLWAHEVVDKVVDGRFRQKVPAHDCAMLKLTPLS